MTSIFSILSVAGFCSLALMAAEDTANYSLWPRRPAELEQARGLLREQKLQQATELLQPFVAEKGIAGREARQITGAVNVRRYLSTEHPGISKYKVQRGDNLARIAHKTSCPADVIMLLNGLVEPSALKVGQVLVTVPMNLRMEIRPLQRELTVWDNRVLVAAYNLQSIERVSEKQNSTTSIKSRDGYINGVILPRHSIQHLAGDRGLVLENGWQLVSGEQQGGTVLRMDSRDLNELTLLMNIGGRVDIVCDEENFSPASSPQ